MGRGRTDAKAPTNTYIIWSLMICLSMGFYGFQCLQALVEPAAPFRLVLLRRAQIVDAASGRVFSELDKTAITTDHDVARSAALPGQGTNTARVMRLEAIRDAVERSYDRARAMVTGAGTQNGSHGSSLILQAHDLHDSDDNDDVSKARLRASAASRSHAGGAKYSWPVRSGGGDYVTEIEIGSPAMAQEVLVDTGSDLVWIQCQPCVRCFSQADDIFDPADSHSFQTSNCSSRVCQDDHLPQHACDRASGSCLYEYRYGDGSSTQGNMASDRLLLRKAQPARISGGGFEGSAATASDDHVPRVSSRRKKRPPPPSSSDDKDDDDQSSQAKASSVSVISVKGFTFGCGHQNSVSFAQHSDHDGHGGANQEAAIIAGPAGVLGLGRGHLSLPSQLAASKEANVPPQFSYCLTPFSSATPSPLFVGGSYYNGLPAEGTSAAAVQFTPILTDGPSATYYYVGLQSISVGGKRLPIPESVFSFMSGGGGSIFDSGTTLTLLPPLAYRHLKDALMDAIGPSVPRLQVAGLDLCYQGINGDGYSDQQLSDLPDVVFHFQGGARMSVPPSNYMVSVDDMGISCFTMMSAGQDFTIIGNLQQQDFHVFYDLLNSRIGFAPTVCSEL